VGSDHEKLDALSKLLDGDEIKVLIRIAERLRFGKKQYGQLNLRTDKRNLREEATQELLDYLVYTFSEEEQKHQRKEGK
jgi:hypothetical protein